MDYFSAAFLIGLMQIIWIDLLLSGDNALVIAMACRSLSEKQRRLGIFLGAGTAVILRIIFAFIISELLMVPFLKLLGGFLLFWIAIKLLNNEDDSSHDVNAGTSLWGVVRTIALADAVMSLDNVVAIAAAAGGHKELFIFGLLLSIPLMIWGSSLILKLIQRFPVVIWAGAALLGWIAAEMIVGDQYILNLLGNSYYFTDTNGLHHPVAYLKYPIAFSGAFFVIVFELCKRKYVSKQNGLHKISNFS